MTAKKQATPVDEAAAAETVQPVATPEPEQTAPTDAVALRALPLLDAKDRTLPLTTNAFTMLLPGTREAYDDMIGGRALMVADYGAGADHVVLDVLDGVTHASLGQGVIASTTTDRHGAIRARVEEAFRKHHPDHREPVTVLTVKINADETARWRA